jgi:hypothetical protein
VRWEKLMAVDKKPSIYYDRGTIGSSDELDEYGVWVKSEPQELASPGAESPEEFPDLEIPGIEDLSGIGDMPDFNIPAESDGFDDSADFEADFDAPFDESSPETETENSEAGDDFSFAEDIDLPDMESGGEDAGESAGFDAIEEEAPDAGEDVKDEAGDLGFAEISFDDFTGGTGAELEETTAEEDSGGFDDAFDLPSEEPVEEIFTEPAGEKPVKGEPSDLSTQLLMKIAQELSSIRAELTGLKKEFAGLKVESPPEGQDHGFFNEEEDDEKIALTGDELNNILNAEKGGTPVETGDSIDISLDKSGDSDAPGEESAEIQGHGFFDEEEDETISLTGDELDNILNTANFTEEAGADANEETGGFSIEETEELFSGEEISEEAAGEESAKDDSFDDTDLDLDISIEEKDLDELGGEIDLDNPADEAVFEPIEASDDFLGTADIDLDLPVEEDEEILKLREEGARPMTPAPEPEDSSYLTEDPLASGQFDEDSLDLSGAVIDEPDLSSEIQDNPVEEPSLDDISIDLDLDEDSFGGSVQEEETPAEETGEFNLDAGEEIELPLSDDEEEEDVPVSPSFQDEAEAGPAPSEADDDLTLIPEGFVVEADDSQSPGGEETGDEDTLPEEDFSVPEDRTEETAVEELPEENETASGPGVIPSHLKQELKTVLSYMDQLLESLPDDKIEEFARSEYFDTYKKLFKELGLV